MIQIEQKKYIKIYHFGATANIFTTWEVIKNVGFLDGTLKSGADLEWGQRIFKAGYRQIYSNEVIVKHPARYSINKIIQKHRRVVGGLYAMKNSDYGLKEFLIDLKDDWPNFPDFISIFKQRINFIHKSNVFFVMLLVKLARIIERILLRLGKPALRIWLIQKIT